jgi:hypothetical protein
MNQPYSPQPDSAASSDEIRLAFSLARRDILTYNLHFNRGLIYLSIILFVMLVPAIGISLKYPSGDLGMFYMWLAIGIGLALIMCSSSLIAIYIQVYYIKNDVVEKAMEFRNYIINSAGIAIFTSNSRLTRPWKDIVKVIESRRGFYFLTGDKAAIIIPHHVFESEAAIKNLRLIIASGKQSK